MGSPRRPLGVEQWTETDQAIIESLLLADNNSSSSTGSSGAEHAASASSQLPAIRPTAATGHAQAHAAAANVPVYLPAVHAHATPSTTTPATPVAYWIPTQPIQHTHPYYILHPSSAYASAAASSHAHFGAVNFDEQDQLTEEERKAKHRAVQRRFVQRKKEEMARVRQEVTRLEKRFKYLQLSSEQQTLEQQNSELQDKVGEPVPEPTREQFDWLLEEECRLAKEAYVPIEDDEFNELLKQTMHAVNSTVTKHERQLDDSSKVHVMGWSGWRVLETSDSAAPSMRFEVSKHFPHVDVDDMVERTWQKVSSPDGYQRFFSQAIMMKVVELQRVNDDSLVIFKTMINPISGSIIHSVDLLCRIRTNDEVLILTKGLPMPHVRDNLPDPSNWSVSLNVLAFRPSALQPPRVTATGVDFRYNCCIEGPSEDEMRYWLMEILFVMVRFENMLVAPMFALTAR